MQLSIDCDVILDPIKVKFVIRWQVRGWILFEQKIVVLSQEMQIEKSSLIMTLS